MTRENALAILVRGTFEDFKGEEEGPELEFKGKPYRLDEEMQRFELAKDASAMANASGGLIVLGVSTTKRLGAPVDVATAIRPIAHDRFDIRRMQSILRDRIYPPIADLAICFHVCSEDDDAGLLSIDVPPQPVTSKYFLVRKPLDQDGKAPGWLIGITIRGIGDVHAQQIGELHAAINASLTMGNRLDHVTGALERIESALAGDHGRKPAPTADPPAGRATDFILQRLTELDR